MYKYEIKYLKKMIDLLSSAKAEYNDASSEYSNTVYMKFLSALNSCFPYDTFAWSSLSEKKKNNALKAFAAAMPLGPLYIVDNTVMHGAKRGAVFSRETIHFKNLLEEPEYIYWSNIIKYRIVSLNDDADIFKLGFTETSGNSLQNYIARLTIKNRYTIQAAKSLAKELIRFREKLCNDTELNRPYTNYINDTVKQAADDAKECIDKDSLSQLDNVSDLLLHISGIMTSVSKEKNKEFCNAVACSIAICDKLSALSNNQPDTLPAGELRSCAAYNEIECLWQEMQNEYLDEHYESLIKNAELALEDKKYADASEYIKKAQTFRHTAESDYLQILVLTDSANEMNKFNRDALSKVCESINMNLIPEDISQKIALNTQKIENHIADVKENMLTRIKEFPTNYFTNSAELMHLSDKYDMIPAMYFVLYGYDFDVSALSFNDKVFLMTHKNVFNHDILDIASLASKDVYYKIRIVLDEKFVKETQAFEKEYKRKKMADSVWKVASSGVDLFASVVQGESDNVVLREGIQSLQESIKDVDRNSAYSAKQERSEALNKEYSDRHDRILAHIKSKENQATDCEELLQLYLDFIQRN